MELASEASARSKIFPTQFFGRKHALARRTRVHEAFIQLKRAEAIASEREVEKAGELVPAAHEAAFAAIAVE